MAIGEQEIFIDAVVAMDPNESRKFCQNPNAFTVAECAGGFVYRLAFTDRVIEKSECIFILNRLIAFGNAGQNISPLCQCK